MNSIEQVNINQDQSQNIQMAKSKAKAKARLINFVGEPGSGKSTAAFVLAGIMKQRGFRVELVPELISAKMLAYSNSDFIKDQLFVLAEQNKMLNLLDKSLDYIISDSPLFLSCIYGKHHWKNQGKEQVENSFNQFVMDLYNSYDNQVILLERHHDYVTDGRVHSEQESTNIRTKIVDFMNNNNISYKTFKTVQLDAENQLRLPQMLLDLVEL